MYYPRQIPYLLDKDFKENIEYQEYNLKEIADYCMCIWTMKSKKISDKSITNNILPDACIDIVIDFINNVICFAGFSKETKDFKLNKKVDYMGVRLKPGSFHFLFNIDASKIMDNEIPFKNIEQNYNLNKIFTLKSVNAKIEALKDYLIYKSKNKKKPFIMDIIEQLYQNPQKTSVKNIALKFGYNQRHLYRIFLINYGVSPKVLLNILRLHLCLTLILEHNMNLTDIAYSCGFYDQSHFIKEIKRYTGISPLNVIETYK